MAHLPLLGVQAQEVFRLLLIADTEVVVAVRTVAVQGLEPLALLLRVLVVLVVKASAIPAYGCLGFLPIFQRSSVKFGGLTTPGEMYVLAVYFVSCPSNY